MLQKILSYFNLKTIRRCCCYNQEEILEMSRSLIFGHLKVTLLLI